MKNLHIVLWTCLFGAGLFLLVQQLYLCFYLDQSFHVLALQFQDKGTLKSTLLDWNGTIAEGRSLLHYARVNTVVDLVYIIGYVSALIMISYRLMQVETSPALNNLLRFCFLLAVLTGLLDLAEDLILLFDMYRFSGEKTVYSARYVAYPKWIAGGAVLLVWLICGLKRVLPSRKSL